jgi:hypothetical protein
MNVHIFNSPSHVNHLHHHSVKMHCEIVLNFHDDQQIQLFQHILISFHLVPWGAVFSNYILGTTSHVVVVFCCVVVLLCCCVVVLLCCCAGVLVCWYAGVLVVCWCVGVLFLKYRIVEILLFTSFGQAAPSWTFSRNWPLNFF